jgi:biofilm PGA synthesis N-glycosyltransferase PgaC
MTRYVVITPARDEESYIDLTIRAIAEQSVRPAQWVIVDDGSRDRTGKIADIAASTHPWITVVHRSDRGFRQAGGGVVAAFYEGLSQLQCQDWEFLIKLDADLSFDPNYLESCFARFQADPALGIAGGGIYHFNNGRLALESNPTFHVRGATKIYKRECWDKLGGLTAAPGWDTIDEVKANMLGWHTRTFPELQVVHHRNTGAADGNWKDSVKNGFANYITGYHPLFMLIKCARRLTKRPYVVNSAGLFWGYAKGYLKRSPRVHDRNLITYTRSQQIRRLIGLSTIWK